MMKVKFFVGSASGTGALIRRIGLLAAIAAAVAFPAGADGGIVTPRRIVEAFVGSTIDYANLWAWWGTNQPGLVDFAQANGVFTVKVSAAAQPDFNVGGQTRCLAHGDFNAQVGFNLVDWPARNGVWVSLMIGGTPYNVYRVSWQFEQSEAYGAYLPPAGTTLPATGTNAPFASAVPETSSRRTTWPAATGSRSSAAPGQPTTCR